MSSEINISKLLNEVDDYYIDLYCLIKEDLLKGINLKLKMELDLLKGLLLVSGPKKRKKGKKISDFLDILNIYSMTSIGHFNPKLNSSSYALRPNLYFKNNKFRFILFNTDEVRIEFKSGDNLFVFDDQFSKILKQEKKFLSFINNLPLQKEYEFNVFVKLNEKKSESRTVFEENYINPSNYLDICKKLLILKSLKFYISTSSTSPITGSITLINYLNKYVLKNNQISTFRDLKIKPETLKNVTDWISSVENNSNLIELESLTELDSNTSSNFSTYNKELVLNYEKYRKTIN